VPPTTNGHTDRPSAATLSTAQHKFCASTVRTLKKMKDCSPFLRPVDPVALNIPHYPSIVKHPMDFSTVERKLNSSNPAKPDPNHANPRYLTADEFIADVRLIFSNALLFNGPDHAVTQMGKRVEAVFDKQIKQLPPADEPKPVPVKVASPTPPPPVAVKKQARRSSTSVPVIRRNEAENVSARPKREIHPPPPKDLPYAEPPKKVTRKVRRPKDAGTMLQLQFCSKLLAELHKKQHYTIAHPFYDPVGK
jgi:bromodomain-containing factor 1